jgi:hypothetical protein
LPFPISVIVPFFLSIASFNQCFGSIFTKSGPSLLLNTIRSGSGPRP